MNTSTAVTSQLVGQRIQELAQHADLAAAAGQVAVQEVGRRRHQVQQGGDEAAQRAVVIDEQQHEGDQDDPPHRHQVRCVGELARQLAHAGQSIAPLRPRRRPVRTRPPGPPGSGLGHQPPDPAQDPAFQPPAMRPALGQPQGDDVRAAPVDHQPPAAVKVQHRQPGAGDGARCPRPASPVNAATSSRRRNRTSSSRSSTVRAAPAPGRGQPQLALPPAAVERLGPRCSAGPPVSRPRRRPRAGATASRAGRRQQAAGVGHGLTRHRQAQDLTAPPTRGRAGAAQVLGAPAGDRARSWSATARADGAGVRGGGAGIVGRRPSASRRGGWSWRLATPQTLVRWRRRRRVARSGQRVVQVALRPRGRRAAGARRSPARRPLPRTARA